MITQEIFWSIFASKCLDVYKNRYKIKNVSFREVYSKNISYTTFTNYVFEEMYNEICTSNKSIINRHDHISEYDGFNNDTKLAHLFQFDLLDKDYGIAIAHKNSSNENVAKEELPKLLELDRRGQSNLSVLFWNYTVLGNVAEPNRQLNKIKKFLEDKDIKNDWLVILGPALFKKKADRDEFLEKIIKDKYDYKAYVIKKNKEFIELEERRIIFELLKQDS